MQFAGKIEAETDSDGKKKDEKQQNTTDDQ